MSKGRSGSMLGVGGDRRHLSKGALRGERAGGRGATPPDEQARKRELLERFRTRKS
ncbi:MULTISPECIES: DUF6243 family protein [Streptomyces]|uniref:DUF6243 family protein n=1 Tax=Streptomyces TaxID=1883 RepID=UPI001476D267|nr:MULTISPECIES: DUF6243 family protein [Streptomyces]